MHVNALDHVNVITANLDGTAAFYEQVLGLERRDGPPPLTPENGQWMCDRTGRPLVHINTADAPKTIERDTPSGPSTGAVHHIALNCSGHPDMLERLNAHGLDYKTNDIAAIGLKQIFLSDPNGVLLELNFFES